MKQLKILFILLVIVVACKKEPKKPIITAQEVVDKAIEIAGANKFDKKEIRFDFRDRTYVSSRNKWKYQYERFKTDSLGNVTHDILSNEGFTRYINDTLATVADTMAIRYSNSVNSVHYFAYLPYGLNDKAVNKELLGEVTIKDEKYYKVKVTFDQEGGGEDFEDVYVYWFNKETFKPDYLAYEFHTGDGGHRFREAYKERYVNEIRFVDYDNYKPQNKNVSVYELDSLFSANKLELLSKIELKNISVSPLDTLN
ncbi:DUF6503 family protein [Leptobacterium sp. I13]|uniref:DUF6503 family protein n=1 Tax=Leptobacterium meishanense TaxID=3128904 RepID=UPI0030EF080B